MVEAIPVFFGFDESPSGTDVDWQGLEPIAEGANTTTCAAAIVPAGPYDSGTTEGFSRYLAAASGRGEPAVVVCEMAGESSGPFTKSGDPPSGIWTGVPDGRLSGRRLPSGLVLELPEDLTAPERDLALRLRNRPDEPPWYGLTRDLVSAPMGDFRSLLVSDVGETVAATWTSQDEAMKWFLLPWGVDWQSTLDWLETQALPNLVPKALARARRRWEEELSTQEEQGIHERAARAVQRGEAHRLSSARGRTLVQIPHHDDVGLAGRDKAVDDVASALGLTIALRVTPAGLALEVVGQDPYAIPAFNPGPRPGTFQSCTLRNRLDYIFVSQALAGLVTGGGIERRGLYGDPENATPPTLWQVYPEIEEQGPGVAASDHAAIFVDVNL